MPWAPDPPVIYEHFHRYLFASRVVAGRDVLDLASGEGFGAALLAEGARSVVGVDIEPQAIEHSGLNYAAPNLEFKVADARDLTSFEPASFGAVVAFEMIEHVAEHDRVLSSIARVLAPDGLLIMSTPERTVYSEGAGSQNPFHVRELALRELLELLHSNFSNVATWGQRMITGSLLSTPEHIPAGNGELQSFIIERLGGDWRRAPGISPKYVIAVASNGELPQVPTDSVLSDPGLELLSAAESAQAQAEQALETSKEAARQQLETLADELAMVRAQLEEASEVIESERRLTAQMQDRAAGDERIIGQLQSELADALQHKAQVEGSVTWQVLQRVRRRVYGALGGRKSPLGNLLQGLLRTLGRLLLRSPG